MLEIKNINVSYGDLEVLQDISLKVEEGEFVAIIGSNGAGKSTTLKTISGLLKPSQGSITFLGERIDKLPPHRIVEKGIAHAPEGRQIFPKMTVIENLEMGAYTPPARRNKEKNLERVFELFPILKERRKQLAETLSGGEQQMLAIGRALMSNPKLLLLDEPSVGLAPRIVAEVFELVKKINETGTSILCAEQNVMQILSVSKRAYVIETGKIVNEGSSKKLLQSPEIKKAYLGIQ